jgi:hypothetical protein
MQEMWWMIIVGAAAIMLIGRVTKSFEVGHIAAVLGATGVTLLAWWLVQRWGLHHLYELVPAFALAAATALVVSRLFPVDD